MYLLLVFSLRLAASLQARGVAALPSAELPGFTSMVDLDPGHRKAGATRRYKLLRPTDQTERHCQGVKTRTEAKGRLLGPAGGSRETPAAAAGESSTQRPPWEAAESSESAVPRSAEVCRE